MTNSELLDTEVTYDFTPIAEKFAMSLGRFDATADILLENYPGPALCALTEQLPHTEEVKSVPSVFEYHFRRKLLWAARTLTEKAMSNYEQYPNPDNSLATYKTQISSRLNMPLEELGFRIDISDQQPLKQRLSSPVSIFRDFGMLATTMLSAAKQELSMSTDLTVSHAAQLADIADILAHLKAVKVCHIADSNPRLLNVQTICRLLRVDGYLRNQLVTDNGYYQLGLSIANSADPRFGWHQYIYNQHSELFADLKGLHGLRLAHAVQKTIDRGLARNIPEIITRFQEFFAPYLHRQVDFPEGSNNETLLAIANQFFEQLVPAGLNTFEVDTRTTRVKSNIVGFQVGELNPTNVEIALAIESGLPAGISMEDFQVNYLDLYNKSADTITWGDCSDDNEIRIYAARHLHGIDLQNIQRRKLAHYVNIIRHELGHVWWNKMSARLPRFRQFIISLILRDRIFCETDIFSEELGWSNYNRRTLHVNSGMYYVQEVVSEIWCNADNPDFRKDMELYLPRHYTILRCLEDEEFLHAELTKYNLHKAV